MNRIVFLIPLALFAAVAVYFAIGLTRDPRIVPSALIDKPVPAFELPSVWAEGDGLSSTDLQGEVSLVNVFASWCVPCKVEHPLFMRLARDNVVTIHGINWKDRTEDARAWLDQLGDPYGRIGQDVSGRTGIDWGVYGVPETYVIDRDGRIRYKHVGPVMPQHLEETLLPLIRELQG